MCVKLGDLVAAWWCVWPVIERLSSRVVARLAVINNVCGAWRLSGQVVARLA